MPVYVDCLMVCIPNKNWKWNKSCHLIADTEQELHDFAIKKLKMKKAWYQKDSSLPHYDLHENKRNLAVLIGVIELERKEFVAKMKEIKEKIKENTF